MATAFPFDDLPRLARGDVAITAALARWLAIRPSGRRIDALVGGPVTLATTTIAAFDDPHAGSCALRVAGTTLEVRGANALVRRIAQKTLGGPAELAAPRPLGPRNTRCGRSRWPPPSRISGSRARSGHVTSR